MCESDERVCRVLPVIIFIRSPALENTLCCSTSRRETDHYPQSFVDADHLKLNLFLHAIRVGTVLKLCESVVVNVGVHRGLLVLELLLWCDAIRCFYQELNLGFTMLVINFQI